MIYGSVCSGIEAATVAWKPLGWKASFFSDIEPFPREVLKHHYPETPLHGDFTTIGKNDYARIDLLVGGTPCFTKETLVLCQDKAKPIDQVKPGDFVLTHKNRYRKVLKVGSKFSETIKVSGQGAKLYTTKDHPVYARGASKVWNNEIRQYRRLFSDPSWIKASELKGSFWASPSVFPKSEPPPISHIGREAPGPDISPELFAVLGRWLGDGWIRHQGERRSYVLICGNKKEKDLIQAEIESIGLNASVSDEKTTVRFQIANKALARWIENNFGCGASTKSIPSWLYGIDKNLRTSFLSGYINADGYRKDGLETVTSVNKELILGFILLQNSLGKSTTITYNQTPNKTYIENREVNQKDFWIARSFDKSRSSFDDGNHRYGLVRKIEDQSINQVFNLEVEEDNSYVSDGIVVHNCQSFSIAGLRGGMDDDRGNLALEYLRLADRLNPKWIVWENVPGVLSSNGGRDFGSFLGALAELGYGYAYRTLDAQFFGVAQRRRRVFVVGYLGDWRRAAGVLFDTESLRGNPPPSRETGEGTTPNASSGAIHCSRIRYPELNQICGTLSDGAHHGGGLNGQDVYSGRIIPETHVVKLANTKSNGSNISKDVAYTLDSSQNQAVCVHGTQDPIVSDIAHPLQLNNGQENAVAFSVMPMNSGKDFKGRETDIAQPLMAGGPVGGNQGGDFITTNMQVRRLTPVECARLQGFPDDYLDIPWKGKPASECPKGHKYKALGNSFAVPVIRWIGERIQMMEDLQ